MSTAEEYAFSPMIDSEKIKCQILVTRKIFTLPFFRCHQTRSLVAYYHTIIAT